MPAQPCKGVSLLCVRVKDTDPPEKVKSKILKGLRNAEGKSSSSVSVSVQTKDLQAVAGLSPNDVVKVVSNSRYITFLCEDGRVCRLKCTSKSDTSSKKDHSVVDILRRSTPTFQELSDVEYARQLQTEMATGLRGYYPGRRLHNLHRTTLTPPPASSLALSQDAVRELGLSSSEFVHVPEYHGNLGGYAFSEQDSAMPLFQFSNQPNMRPSTPPSTFSLATSGSSRSPYSNTLPGSSSKKDKNNWPDIGKLQWASQGEEGSCLKFVAIAALHSEILLVSYGNRTLYSWPCEEDSALTPHPLTSSLGLTGERVSLLEAGDLRASLVTESGKVATFYDRLLRAVPESGPPPLISSLSHGAKVFPELEGETVCSLSLSDFITVATTSSGRVLWWGLCPERPGHKSRPLASSSKGAVTDGCLVKLKDGPPCGPNAIVYSQSPTGSPLVGRTMNIIEHSGLNSKSSVLVKVYKESCANGDRNDGDGRSKEVGAGEGSSPLLRDLDSMAQFDNLEVWKLNDVVFLDDSPSVLGRVVTVDQHQAIVDVSRDSSTATNSIGAKSSLKVFRTSDLELCMTPLVNSDPGPSAHDQGTSVGTSQHIAGVVQHKPVCLLTPAEVTPPQTDSAEETIKTTGIVHGCRPLAVHTTNSGPTLLVEHVSDRHAFLVCSGQASTGPFVTSSYVALGDSKNSKPSRSTIADEAVPSIEGGFTTDTSLTNIVDVCKESLHSSGGSKEEKKESVGSKRGREDASPIRSELAPMFISCHNTQVLMLKDVNGLICPLTNGLRLKPCSTTDQVPPTSDLTACYKCVLSRSYSLSKDQRALVFVLVPKQRYLMPAVLSGNVCEVDSVLQSLTAADPSSNREEEPPSKKAKLDSGQIVTVGTNRQLSIDAEVDVVEKASDSNEQGHTPGLEALLECTVHNCNILHVCCQLTGTGTDDHVTVSSSGPSDPQSSDNGCLSERRMVILDRLLQSELLRPLILKLLCARNSYGHTPFFSAISNQNYATALKIFQFIRTLPDPGLTRDALLPPSSNTPLTELFASLSATYDTTSMCLHVSNLPTSYRAQFLLKLFQRRYPSVFKAVVSRKKGEGGSESENSSDSSGEDDTSTWTSGLASSIRNRARVRRHRTYNAMSLTSRHTSSSSSLSGVVYFADVNQLRAAIKEMHDYKLTTSVSRNTGFGQTQSIHYLSVHLLGSNENSAEENNNRSLHNMQFFASTTAKERGKSRVGETRRSGGKLFSWNKFSHPSLAHSLLCDLLSLGGVATTQDNIGETTLASVVHNTKCLEALQEIRKGQSPQQQETSDSQQSSSSDLPPPVLAPANHDLRMYHNYTTLADLIHNEHAYSQERTNNGGVGGASSRFPRATIPVMPYATLAEYLDSFSTQVDLGQVIRDQVSTPMSSLDAGETANTRQTINAESAPSTGVITAQSDHTRSEDTSMSTGVITRSEDTSTSSGVITAQSDHTQSDDTTQPLLVNTSGTNSADEAKSDDVSRKVPAVEQSLSDSRGSIVITSSPRVKAQLGTSTANSSPLNKSVSFGTSVPVCSCQTHSRDSPPSEITMLPHLASSWPCVVTTILGFYPNPDAVCNSDLSTSDCYSLSTVHTVDSFTSDLILNCDRDTISSLVDTVTSKMNKAISLASSSDLSLLTETIDWSKVQRSMVTESNVALVVGRRFLESVVRVLAMKHSQAQNAFMEMQQLRQANGGRQANSDLEVPQSSRGNGGQRSQQSGQARSTKDLSKVVRSILTQFSWLSVHSLVQAAEAAIAPVRLGVAKPLGASSVVTGYQQGGSYGYYPGSSYGRRSTPQGNESAHQSLSRQIHTRTALPRSNLVVPPRTQPPADGVLLRPVSGDGGEGAGTSTAHDDSFDDLDMDVSDQEATEDHSRRRPGTQFDPLGATVFVPTVDVSNYFMELDSDHSDDDEFPLGAVYHTTIIDGDDPGQQGNNEEESVEDIYPFAWALDGRRIGETSSHGGQQNIAANITLVGSSAEAAVPLCNIPSIRFGSGFLARTFARLVKDMVDTVQEVCSKDTTDVCVHLPPAILQKLTQWSVDTLEKTWGWVSAVLDVAEGQLQRGNQFDTEHHVMSLRTGGRQGESGRRPGRTSCSFVGSTPSEYIAYLLRSHDHEDNKSLPVIDLYGYEHVVYCLDSLIYTLSNIPKNSIISALTTQTTPCDPQRTLPPGSNTPETQGGNSPVGSRFFARTESVIICSSEEDVKRSNEQFFGEGSMDPDTFGESRMAFARPLNEAYPLANQPHLLQPFAQREALFGGWRDEVRGVDEGRDKKSLPVTYSDNEQASGPITTTWTAEKVYNRWHSAISVFAHIFLAEGPGGERSNFLNSRAGFASRMARFRHQVAQLYDVSQRSRDWSSTVSSTLSIRVRRENLLQDSLDMLQAMTRFHYSSVRVKFEGEDGSGPGVNRGFFASLANEIKSSDQTIPPANKLGLFLHQPGKLPEQLGIYAPCPFVPALNCLPTKKATLKAQRRSSFLSIGRFLGLCLWFRYTIPLTLCRHVAKFLLGREIAWHDLAFHNADLYEGMRRMIVDTEQDKKDSEEFMATYCCYFEAPLSGHFSEPVLVDLIPGGSKIPVTPERVQEYVRLYAMHTMVGCVSEELQAMKEGLNDIVPPELLSSLTAEDFQLLLSGGSTDISVSRLKSVISFNHTHGGSPSFRQHFEKMFWRVVRHMTNTQRQQLLYFATGSAALPASSDTTNRDTPIAITIDVISTTDMDSLPVASTCSQRMSLPLYPSYIVLKKKMLQAIQCQAYGLG